jgi:hypothetical protein
LQLCATVLNVTPFAEFETDYLKAAWILLQESGQG